jgi:uncharacterized sulfatase
MKDILAVLVVVFAFNSAVAAETKPNIIVFYTDDHGYADLGIHGVVNDIRTPHLDALARSGVVVRNGYSTAPQCVPSRGGLLTGKFQGRFNLDSNSSTLDGFNQETTIATRLQRAGYVTAQFGKWHLGPTPEITKHGFKHVYAQHGQQKFSANVTADGKDRPMSDLAPEMYHIDGCSRAAASVIERYQEQPFFLYIAYRAPHTPLDAPSKYTERFPGPMPERRRQALAMLSAVDDGVGLVTDTLRKHGLTERTLIFFIGDNGAPLKIHKTDSPLKGDPGGWDGSLNTPLNGEKGMLAEGGMHVPFLVAWPGQIPANRTFDHPVTTLDVAATAAGIANLDVKSRDLDGVNLVPYLNGEIQAPPHERLMWRWSAQSAIREGNWKLLRGGEREYLYDLSADLEEKHNLAAQHPDIANRLRAELKAWSDELTPPGLALGPMAQTWNDYFDVYLEGKAAVTSSGLKSAKTVVDKGLTNGWEARNATLVAKDGLLEFTSQQDDKPAFITRSRLRFAPPVSVRIVLKAAASGPAAVAWREDGDKDFLPTRRTAFQLAAANEWETHDVSLPASNNVIHVRVHLPKGTHLIREIEFKR